MLRSCHLVLFTACLLGAWEARAQCTQGFSFGSDTTLCEGQTLLLTVPAGYATYQWTNGSTGTSLLVDAPGTYGCTTTVIDLGSSLVTNGNFTAGSTGFTSDYVPGVSGPWGSLSNPATYGVSTSPSLLHSNFAFFGDHTTGTGGMLVVNGAQVVGQSVWCQTVAVQPNTTYAFSAWLASCVGDSPAQLQFTVNGAAVGNLNAPVFTGSWVNFYNLRNSGAATVATICITNLNTAGGGNDFALDDITFSPFCTYTDQITVGYQAYPDPFLGPDQTVCEPNTVTFNATWPGATSYLWHDGGTTPTHTANATGTVWVEVTEGYCMGRDTALVTVLPLPVVDLGPDRTSCEGQTEVLTAFFPGASYLWSDGSTGPTLATTTTGTYSVTATLNGCVDSDAATVTFHPLPIVDLGADTALCAADQLVLDVTRPGGSYLWEDGSTAGVRSVSGGGTYTVTVTELGCSTTDARAVGIIPLPEVDLGPDPELCIGTSMTLVAGGPGFTYLWTDGSTLPYLELDAPDTYGVTVSNSCGTVYDEVEVNSVFCDCPVYVPVAFSPNDDGINDVFLPVCDCPLRSYALRIFDRWGGLVWETSDPAEAWKGPEEVNGVFVWVVEVDPEPELARGKRSIRGHVVMLR
jgi:gliding motility-associated-like protein